MLRPKNFRELRKSVITQKDKSPQIISRQNQMNTLNQPQKNNSCFKKLTNLSNVSSFPSQNGLQGQYYTQDKMQKNYYASPNRFNVTSDYTYQSPSTSKSNNLNISQLESNLNQNNQQKENKFLKFDDKKIKKKLNFNQLPQRFVRERLSSRKKDKLNFGGALSFKSIIENSPQCRQLNSKNQNGYPSNSKWAESQRQPQRESSLTKLKYQFGDKKLMSKSQIQGQKQILVEEGKKLQFQEKKEPNQPQIICFTKKISKMKTKCSQNQKTESKNVFDPIESLWNQTSLLESHTDLVNMSRDSYGGDNNIYELDMSPYV